MRKQFSKIVSILIFFLIGVQIIISCSANIELPPTPDNYSSSDGEHSASSSSNLLIGTVLCSIGGNCISIPAEDCSIIGGQAVQNCPATSSSSSSNGCKSSATYCNYGGCSQWSSNGGSCAMHINGYKNEGGCYPMPTEDNCMSGTIVSVCPANAIPPASNYCELPSSSSSSIQTGIVYGPSVEYEGETYETVVIGTQTWFQRNLNYAVSGSKCGNGSSLSDGNTATCNTYGRLYDWATAMGLNATCNSSICSSQIQSKHKGICPQGWHIPSNAEWDILVKYVDPNYVSNTNNIAGTKLKSTSGWKNHSVYGNGTDNYGFAALPGGIGRDGWNDDGTGFTEEGGTEHWWTAYETSSSLAYLWRTAYDLGRADWLNYHKRAFLNIRCVKD